MHCNVYTILSKSKWLLHIDVRGVIPIIPLHIPTIYCRIPICEHLSAICCWDIGEGDEEIGDTSETIVSKEISKGEISWPFTCIHLKTQVLPIIIEVGIRCILSPDISCNDSTRSSLSYQEWLSPVIEAYLKVNSSWYRDGLSKIWCKIEVL
jgi:hypothetical protein